MTDHAKPSPPPRYVVASPAGALRTVSRDRSPACELLRSLLRLPVTPALSDEALVAMAPGSSRATTAESFTILQRQGLIELHERSYRLGDEKVELVLPELLDRLSGTGRGLLADNEGFLVSSVGYDTDQSTTMAAMAADLAETDERWRSELRSAPTVDPPTWSTTGPDGSTRLHFIILTIGAYPFVLVLEGAASLVDPAFVWLVWSLSHRYDRSS